MSAPAVLRPGGLARPEAALFVLALGVYAYFFQAGGWNQNSRFNLVRSIVEQHGIVIDDYVHNTGDTALRDRHYYCDKAPGVSLLAVPAYAAVHPFAGGQRPRGRLVNLGAYLSTVWAVGLPSALAVVMLYRLGLLLGTAPAAAAMVALAYAFGSLAFPYSTLFYGHQLAAALLMLAFGLIALVRRPDGTAPISAPRLFLAGLLLGYVVVVEYPGALGVAVVCLYAAMVVRPWPRLLWLAAAGAIPVLALGLYHTAAFGGPLVLPYEFSNDPTRQQGLFLGLGRPGGEALLKILFSPTKGLLRFAPWLALWLPGVILLARQPRHRAEAAVCALLPISYLWFNSSLTTSPIDWRGGWGIGPRFLIPSLPFLALGVVGLFARDERPESPAGSWRRYARRASLPAFGILAGYSVFLMFVATTVRPEVPTWYDEPFADYLFPLFADGQLAVNTLPIHTGFTHERREAWNLGETLGLQGLATLLPLAAFVAGAVTWLGRTLRRSALVVAVLLAALAVPASAGDEPPKKELAREAYEVVLDPAKLPADVQAAWAAELRQRTLHVAAAGAPFNLSDVGMGNMPRHGLVLAGVGPGYAVVHFVSGGFASSSRVMVFARGAEGSRVVWRGRGGRIYDDPKRFLGAIRSGKLFKDHRPARP